MNVQESRSSKVKKNILLGFGIKGISILVSLMLVPLTIDYVSSELYGIWLTISTIVSWIGFFDVGFGNGLRNKLTEAIALNQRKKAKTLLSSTYAILFLIFSTVGVVLYFVSGLLNWSSIIGVSPCYSEILTTCVRLVMCSFSVQIILKVLQNVLQAHQMVALSSAIDTVSNLFILITIWILTKTIFPDLRILSVVFSLTPVIVYLFISVILYNSKFKDISPSVTSIDFSAVKGIFSLGSQFFIIQIVCIVLFQTTNLLISRICGAESVTIYNVVYKYLSVSLMAFQIILAPIWSAFTDAYARGEWCWMKKIYRKLLKCYYYSVCLVISMVAASPLVYRLWLGDTVAPDISITICVALYLLTLNYSSLHSMIINGIGTIRVQLYCSILQMILFIPTAIVLGFMFGLCGIVMSLAVVLCFSCMLERIQVIKILNRNARGVWAK